MKRRYLLDTNVVSEMIRRPAGMVTKRIAEVGEFRVCTSIVVVCELRFGVEKAGSKKLSHNLERILSVLPVMPLEDPAAHRYAIIRSHLERLGTPIDPNDLLIAAHALSLNLTLVTDNAREFSRVPGLAVENRLGAARRK